MGTKNIVLLGVLLSLISTNQG